MKIKNPNLFIDPQLMDYLRKKRLVRKFIQNMNEHRSTNTVHPTIIFYISQAFMFTWTPEGHSYWWGQHLKYKKISQRQ